MGKKALIIVDVQEAMISLPDEKPFEFEYLVKNIQTLRKKAKEGGVQVIYIQHTSDKGLLKKGSGTWEIYHEIAPSTGDIIVQKNKWDSFMNTKLEEVLAEKGIDQLVFCGMQTEFCLDTTCRRAFSLGYQSVLVSDAHTTFDTEILDAKTIIRHHNSIIGGRFAALVTTEEAAF